MEVGASSRDIRFSKKVNIESAPLPKKRFDENSTFSDFMDDPRLAALLKPVIDSFNHVNDKKDLKKGEAVSPEMMAATFGPTPIRNVLGFGDGTFDHEKLRQLTDKANKLIGLSD